VSTLRHRPVVMGTHAMVSSAHPLASLTGMDVLRSGGNAVDATVAINAALNVVQPGCCGIGGDLFALVYWKKAGKVYFLNGSGRVAKGAGIEKIRSMGYTKMPFRGIFSVSVPGCVDAWDRLLQRFGTRSMDKLLQPAIELAREGFPLSHKMAEGIRVTYNTLKPHPSWIEIFVPDGKLPRPGEKLVQTDLARSFEAIAHDGREAFYSGELGQKLIDFSRQLGGWLTGEDLLEHWSLWAEPVSTDYRGYKVYETPPNTQGLIALEMLNIVEGFDIGKMDWEDPKRLHLMIEAKRLAYLDRDAFLSDPGFSNVPVDRLISKGYAQELRNRIDPDRRIELPKAEGIAGDTTYFCVVDQEGNVVSCVQSLFKGFGSLLVVPDTGICLHNRGSYFRLDPDHPNALAPGKRPLHTLTASIVMDKDVPRWVWGTMGGDAQPLIHLQGISNLIDYGLDPQSAIEAPRWVHGPTRPGEDTDILHLESRFSECVITGLAQRGHSIMTEGAWFEPSGHAQAIAITPDGVLQAGADPRGDGYALGW
jgi:gamma-glutamyltranspeptidase